MQYARCLKITEKVSFNIANVDILSDQKLLQKRQKWSILAIFRKLKACSQTVLPDRLLLKGQKNGEKFKVEKLKCNILSNF